MAPHRFTRITVCRTVVLGVLLCFGYAATALADAPDPIPGATTGGVVQNADGSFTLTVQGQWQWPTHKSDCSTNRAGVGYAIAWNDPSQPGNPVVGRDLTVSVGTPTDNVAHPVPPDPRDVASPDQFASWRGGCGTFNGTYNTGTWGPIQHTYPATYAGTFSICPIMYDVHGDRAGSEPKGVKEITAGGPGHNGDNSLEANNNTPLGNGCFTTTFPRPIPGVPPTPLPPAAPPPPPIPLPTAGSAAAQLPARCISLPQRVHVRAKHTTLLIIHVAVNGQDVSGALVRITLPGGNKLFRRTNSDGIVRVFVRPKRSGTLIIQTKACSGAVRINVAKARRRVSPARYTG